MEVRNADFVACLALFQHRRDAALGLAHITAQQRGLIWYYNILRQDAYRELVTKSFYLGVIRGARKRIKQIKKLVRADTPLDEAQLLYREALILQENIKQAAEVING